MFRKCPNVPKVFKRAPDRVTKVLKGEAIPEYTAVELDTLLDQRNRLQVSDTSDNTRQKKSYNNLMYFRQLGRTDNMEQSRLFPHARTNSVHVERIWELGQDCIKQGQASNPGQATGPCWTL